MPNESLGKMSTIGTLPTKKNKKIKIDIAYSFKSTYKLIRQKLVDRNYPQSENYLYHLQCTFVTYRSANLDWLVFNLNQ